MLEMMALYMSASTPVPSTDIFTEPGAETTKIYEQIQFHICSIPFDNLTFTYMDL